MDSQEGTNNVKEHYVEDELKHSFLDYSMSVITSRALPDVRDGLKPVHRRILYSMWEQKMFSKSGYYKSARIVGDVIGKYHPHGDSSVYEALVRMAQPWSLMANLADGQGNFGSMSGDGAAAMRYTEAKMTNIAEEMLKELEKNNVPYRENYDGRSQEPIVLPARFPNVLVNGVQGIAVGMASNIPTHNLAEVCDAAIQYIQNPDMPLEELMEFLPGPDFPTGGHIMGDQGIIDAYETGKGTFKIRGDVQIEESENSNVIVITQVPYQVTKDALVKRIRSLQTDYEDYKRKTRSSKNKRFMEKKPNHALNFIKRDGLIDRTDANSTEDNFRIEIHLIDGIDPRIVVNHLFKYTQLETSFTFNNTVLVPGKNNGVRPKRLGLKDVLEEYLKHQLSVFKEEYRFDLNRHKKDLHQTEALIKALSHLDDAIEQIKTAKSNSEAVAGLVDLLDIDEDQATFILNKRIRTLSGFQQEETRKHYEFLKNEIERIENILSDESKIRESIMDELEVIKENFGIPRRTDINPPAEVLDSEDLIQNERVVVTMSNNGYIKSTKEDKYKSQMRNGRGNSTMNLDEDDFIIHLEVMYKHDDLLLFTNYGKVYELKGYDVPETNMRTKGVQILNLLPGIEDGEQIQSVLSVKTFSETQYLFFETSKGLVKKTALSEYENIRGNGIIAIDLAEGDRLVNVNLTDGDMNIILVTRNGKSISFHESDVRSTGRSTKGVRGIEIKENDYVVSGDIHESFGNLFLITEKGYGKKTDLSQFKTQNRGGSGIIALKTTEKTGLIASTVAIEDDDSVFILSSKGSLIKIHSKNLSRFNRNAQGTHLINLRDNDIVKQAACISVEAEDDQQAENDADETND